jgi:glycosyltransferase involved in cell wall biosynthesis
MKVRACASPWSACCAYLHAFAPRGAWELIVVDDGSSDDTAAIAAEFVRRDPLRVRFLQHPVNLGLTAALETGAAVARCRSWS